MSEFRNSIGREFTKLVYSQTQKPWLNSIHSSQRAGLQPSATHILQQTQPFFRQKSGGNPHFATNQFLCRPEVRRFPIFSPRTLRHAVKICKSQVPEVPKAPNSRSCSWLKPGALEHGGNHCLLAFTGESSVYGFSGDAISGFRIQPSTASVFYWTRESSHLRCGSVGYPFLASKGIQRTDTPMWPWVQSQIVPVNINQSNHSNRQPKMGGEFT